MSICSRVYNADYIPKLHAEHRQLKSFAMIVDKDSPGVNFGFSNDINTMQCIDLDEVETQLEGKNDQTVDCVVTIGKFNQDTQCINSPSFLLVELKLNCVSHTLGINDYKGKVMHSKDLLASYAIPFEPVFLFTDLVKNRALSFLNRYKRSSEWKYVADIKVHTPKEFNDFVQFSHAFPYHPINSAEKIVSDLNSTTTIDDLAARITYWKQTAQNYLFRGNSYEKDSIITILNGYLDQRLPTIADATDRAYLTLL